MSGSVVMIVQLLERKRWSLRRHSDDLDRLEALVASVRQCSALAEDVQTAILSMLFVRIERKRRLVEDRRSEIRWLEQQLDF